LERHSSQFKDHGLAVVAIGIGEPKHAAYFGPRLAPSVTCLSVSSPRAHAAYGIGRVSTDALLQPGMVAAAIRATAHGHVQGKATGDAGVLSGTFLVETTGTIRYAYYSRYPGDDPAIDDLLHAAEASHLKVNT
jgi:peroxiredoxin